MSLEWADVIILILSGLAVGFTNTIAGGATVISISVFMLLGLPPLVANGTNRIAILMQNITSVYYFNKKKLIDWSKIIRYAIPIILGSIVGAGLSYFINDQIFKYIFAVAIVLFAFSMFFHPERWINENEELMKRPYTWFTFALFFLVGIYGGLIHVGIGYFLLAIFVLYAGQNLVTANVLKNLVVLLYVPFALAVFATQGLVNWEYGLVHGIGNIIGAWVAARLSIKKGANFVRYFLIFIITLVFLQFVGVLTPENILKIMNHH